jgi:hypothetical protein
MDDIHTEIAVVGTKLDQSQSLQNRFDLWVNTHSLTQKDSPISTNISIRPYSGW